MKKALEMEEVLEALEWCRENEVRVQFCTHPRTNKPRIEIYRAGLYVAQAEDLDMSAALQLVHLVGRIQGLGE